MPATLDLRHESLLYTGNFARPTFELWGAGGVVVRHIYEALSPYQVKLQNFQLSAALASAADTILTVNIGSTVLKFSFEKIEASFAGFSEEEFQRIPKFLQTSTAWLSKVVPDFLFGSHQIQYFSHSFLKGTSVDEFLKARSPKTLKLAGFDLGTGVIFHRSVPEKKWVTQLTLDRSQFMQGALFVGLLIRIETGVIDYESLLAQGREYFQEMIDGLELTLPDPA
jgi:hypothetical protein